VKIAESQVVEVIPPKAIQVGDRLVIESELATVHLVQKDGYAMGWTDGGCPVGWAISKSSVVEVIPAVAPIPATAVVKVIPPKRNIKEFLKVGDKVYIPACDKFGVIERISCIEGKDGLFGRVHREDGEVRDILIEWLEVAK
jgi:hypothetical protein